jgi:hypothetical protein
MVETVVAAGDLFTAIPQLWESAKIPLSIVVIVCGVAAGAFSIVRGIGAAAGKIIGAIALSAIVLGAVGLSASFKETIDKHGGGVTVGQYGR